MTANMPKKSITAPRAMGSTYPSCTGKTSPLCVFRIPHHSPGLEGSFDFPPVFLPVGAMVAGNTVIWERSCIHLFWARQGVPIKNNKKKKDNQPPTSHGLQFSLLIAPQGLKNWWETLEKIRTGWKNRKRKNEGIDSPKSKDTITVSWQTIKKRSVSTLNIWTN